MHLASEDETAHAAQHLAVAVPVVLVVVAARRVWPRPRDDRAAKGARMVLLSGLGVFGVGQLVEAAGAFGFEGDKRVNWLAAVHDFAVALSQVGIIVTVMGALVSATIGFALRGRRTTPRWLLAAIVVGLLGAMAFVIGGIVFGY